MNALLGFGIAFMFGLRGMVGLASIALGTDEDPRMADDFLFLFVGAFIFVCSVIELVS